MKKRLILLVIISVGLCFRGTSAESPQSHISKIQLAADLIGAGNVRYAVLSPDGTQIAYTTGKSLCLYVLDTQKTTCSDFPDTFKGLEPIYWSPDSQHIAFTEDVIRNLDDGHIWLFDVTTGKIENRTDNHFYGSVFGKDAPNPLNIDYFPIWDITGQNLYFFRTVKTDKTVVSLLLMKLPSSGGDPVLVSDLTAYLSAQLNIYSSVPFGDELNDAAAVSPDGKQMAVVVRPESLNKPGSGIWILDLAGGTPQQVVDATKNFTGGLPDWATQIPFNEIMGLSWTKDGTGLVFWVENIQGISQGLANIVYYSDLKTITPLLDFTQYTSKADFIKIDPASGDSPISKVPHTGIFLADRNTVLTINGIASLGKVTVTEISLPPNVGNPTVLSEIHDYKPIPAYAVSVSSDGTKALMRGYLITLDK